MVKKRKKRLSRFLIISSSLFVLVLFSLMSIKLIHGESLVTPLYKIIMLPYPPEHEKPSLQLYTWPYITQEVPTPTPIIAQNPNTPQYNGTPQDNNVYCAAPGECVVPPGSNYQCHTTFSLACPRPASGICRHDQHPGSDVNVDIPHFDDNNKYCVDIPVAGGPQETGPNFPPQGCIGLCISKPVVYLYPTKITDTSVSVVSPGSVVVSDPHYPEGGWKNVIAHPDGTLLYNNKKYSELFYETSINQKISTPKKGIIMTHEDIENVLRKTTTQFGLNPIEQKEFLDYWVPELQSLHSPYIFFSILDPDIKESIDKLVISPEPETRIELIAYFKPLQAPIQVAPLSLPDKPPSRIGFTEVEWGGTIAN